MEEKEYLEKLKSIKDEASLKERNLQIEFALSNAKFKKGDVIQSTQGTILIDKITVYSMFNLPEAAYHGLELKKDLSPRKDKNRITIYGNNAELLKEGNTNN